MKKILIILIVLLYFGNCKNFQQRDFVYQLSENATKREDVNDAISINLRNFNSELVRIQILLADYKPHAKDLDEKDADIVIKRSTYESQIQFTIPKGTYFGKIQVNSSETYPGIYSEFTSLQLEFAFEGDNSPLDDEQSLKCHRINKDFLNYNRYSCPKLVVFKESSLNLDLKRDNKSGDWVNGTSEIWIMAVIGSLYSASPAGLIFPVFLGPVGNSKKVEIEEEESDLL